MQKFLAKANYYIHDFSAIKSWFGNRGFEIQEEDLSEWCYDGYFLYYTCNFSAPCEIQPAEGDKNCITCILDSEYFELYEEMDYSKSPFANKIQEV